MESDKINGTSRGKLDLQLLFSHARLASLLSLCFRDLIIACLNCLFLGLFTMSLHRLAFVLVGFEILICKSQGKEKIYLFACIIWWLKKYHLFSNNEWMSIYSFLINQCLIACHLKINRMHRALMCKTSYNDPITRPVLLTFYKSYLFNLQCSPNCTPRALCL